MVALRKESVDRKDAADGRFANAKRVALRKESVDRKLGHSAVFVAEYRSLSARRAWIENTPRASKSLSREVALRKESVDRKSSWATATPQSPRSLSARRAWIENPGLSAQE